MVCFNCCKRAFSSCGERGLLSSCGMRASHCSGFSCCRAWILGMRAVVAAVHGLSCFMECAIFLGPGAEPVSLALQDGFLTTGPPGKSLLLHFNSLLSDKTLWRWEHPGYLLLGQQIYNHQFIGVQVLFIKTFFPKLIYMPLIVLATFK